MDDLLDDAADAARRYLRRAVCWMLGAIVLSKTWSGVRACLSPKKDMEAAMDLTL
jgi:hypothetical protein